ncbi:hypothetical protein FGG08_003710 [Glutinoglossum americanum]|uniref:Acyltransferase 3 domain-containing protein n=1 Tax=Glutinoglossum americanum TaxID=1670608 RepID=A0A9P8HXQ6_9PEZI|nr:hypothetical protein FGG08_003710 [Glutinoglossum americanum]
MTAKLLPQPLRPRDVRWVDGLRGIASMMVIGSHLVLCFARHLIFPAPDADTPPLFFQLPIIRLPEHGPPWVIIFIVLSSYAAALKPIKLSRARRAGEALSSLASSSFRRTGRLVLPSLTATVLSWFLCQIGAYKIAKSSDAWWMAETSRVPSSSWSATISDLISGIVQTWTDGENPYDQPQWTLPVLLKASMLTYTLLLATVHAQPAPRMLIALGFYIYSWRCSELIVGVNVAAGVLLAELSQHPITHRVSSSRSLFVNMIPMLLFFSGLYLCSFPDHHPEWSPYFSPLLAFGMKHFPAGEYVFRYWNAIGAHLVVLGIVFSSHLMRALSHPVFLFLGGVSFPLYLLQGPTIRSVLAWVLFGFTSPVQLEERLESGDVIQKMVRPIPSTSFVSVVLVFYFGFLFWVSHFWSIYLEPRFAWATQRTEAIVFGDRVDSPTASHHVRSKSNEANGINGINGVNGVNGFMLPK